MRLRLNLVQKFTLLSVVSTVVIVVGLGSLVSAILTQSLLNQEAQITAEAINSVTSIDLPPKVFEKAVRESDPAPFIYIWNHFRQLPNVFRVKFYDRNGVIVWSDQPELIGKAYADNEELQESLAGSVEVEVGRRKTEHEYETEFAPEEEILEIYVPLGGTVESTVYGVAEIYKHPEGFFAAKGEYLRMVWAGGTVGGLLLFLLLYGLFRGALEEQRRLQQIEQQYSSIELEMEIARTIQDGLLPARLPQVPGLSLASYHRPSRTIGGDYFDVFPMDDGGLTAVVADVQGKGIPGALLMVEVQSLVKRFVESSDNVSDVIRAVNQALTASTGGVRFATLAIAAIDPGTKTLRYSSAGHCPPLLVRASTVLALECEGLVLGLDAEAEYDECTHQLESGDVLLLYTDGVTDTQNEQRGFFGHERLVDVLQSATPGGSPQDILDRVNEALAEYRGTADQHDDIAMVCLVVNRSAARAAH